MKYLTYNDVCIKPKYSTINSRKEVSLSVTLQNDTISLFLQTPLCSANMDTITGKEMAIEFSKLGGLPFLTRNMSIEDNVDLYNDVIEEVSTNEYVRDVVCTIGAGDKEFERFKALYDTGASIFCIDLAHGHHKLVQIQAHKMRTYALSQRNEVDNDGNILLIAGNIATEEAALDYLKWGIDIAKCGIGSGGSCTTRMKTGVGVPQLEAIRQCSKIMPVIADGGIRCPGDIAKAIGAGAHAVMLGSMISGTDETPGVVDIVDGKATKLFRGMSSYEVNIKNNDGVMPDYKTAEGISTYVLCKGPVKDIVNDINGGLRSACTYVGVDDITFFKDECEFIEITNSGYIEGTPHIHSL